MAGLDGNQVPVHRSAEQRQIADDVEHFVPDELVRISQRFVGEHCIFTNDDGVFETATFNEPILDQKLYLFEKTKRPRMRDVALPAFGSNFEAAKLGETAFFVGAGAGNFEDFVGKKGHHRFAHFQFNWRGDDVRLAAFFLGDDSG